VGAFAAALIAFGVAGPAAAQPETSAARAEALPPAGFANWDQVLDLQNRMHVALEHILQADSSLDSGFAGSVTAAEDRQLVVYWRGQVPAAVQRVIDTERLALPITVLAARYSEAELNAAIRAMTLVSRPTGKQRQTRANA
jgi:hypothetical protein